MDWQTIVSCSMIFIGSIIMVCNIFLMRKVLNVLPLVSNEYRGFILRFIKIHALLMVFFFAGYIAVIGLYIVGLTILSKLFVGSIFMFGSVYVLITVFLQTRMSRVLQSTISSLIPVCSNCKKVHVADGKSDDGESWISIERYIINKTDTVLSHGLCPECSKALYPDFT
jgi:hypothetical protein